MARKKKELVEKPEDFAERFNRYMEVITPRTKINSNDVAEMRRRFVNYRNATEAYGMEYGNQTAYYAIGLSENQVRQYTGQKYNDNPERGDFLRNMKFYLAAYREQSMAKGYMNPVNGIFWQKNYDGLRDVQEVQIASPEIEVRDIKSIASRYQDVVDVEFERHKQLEAPAETVSKGKKGEKA